MLFRSSTRRLDNAARADRPLRHRAGAKKDYYRDTKDDAPPPRLNTPHYAIAFAVAALTGGLTGAPALESKPALQFLWALASPFNCFDHQERTGDELSWDF